MPHALPSAVMVSWVCAIKAAHQSAKISLLWTFSIRNEFIFNNSVGRWIVLSDIIRITVNAGCGNYHWESMRKVKSAEKTKIIQHWTVHVISSIIDIGANSSTEWRYAAIQTSILYQHKLYNTINVRKHARNFCQHHLIMLPFQNYHLLCEENIKCNHLTKL